MCKMATCAFQPSVEDTVQQLNELFGSVLNLDTIRKVAESCRYDVTESSNKLLEITSFPVERNVLKLEEKGGYRNMTHLKSTIVDQQVAPLSIPIKNASVLPKMSKKGQNIERAIKYIQKGYKVLIIMRGVPGCGKTYLAKDILQSTIGLDNNHNLHILSTDDFFCQNGNYLFNPAKLQEAHGWNHNRAFQALSRGFSPVIIDNTNTQMWEMKPYAMMATDFGYVIEIIEPDTHWCFNPKELAKRNAHGVPRAKIKDMVDRYEPNITAQKLLSAYDLTYRLQKPPQMRLYPPVNINNSISTASLSNNINVPQNINSGNNIIKSKSASALNLRPLQSKSEPMETINLMDFNEESNDVQPVIKMWDNEISITSWSKNSVDDILMCSNDSTNKNVDVLVPSQQNVTDVDVIVLDSSDEENEMTQTKEKLFHDIETAWGVNENALRSWDIVTPIKDEGNVAKFPLRSTDKPKITTIDSSCNTEDDYFQLLRNKQITAAFGTVKVLDTVNRDINRFTPKRQPTVLKKFMQDKSCLTDDIFEDYDNHMAHLVSLFPSVPRSHLNYWYNKCNGDLEWTIEFLLEAKEEAGKIEENIVNDVDMIATSKTESECSNCKPMEVVNSKEGKIKRARKTSDEYKDIKKLIESKVDINNEHYSKHLLKVKQFKFGNGNELTDNSKPSTSATNDAQLTLPSNISRSPSTKSSFSDMDFEELDGEGEDNTVPEQQPEETIELNLGDNFVAQLEEQFGDPNMTYPKGFQPVVQMPVTLARQLYMFYIESVYQQMETQKQVMDTLYSEDEAFARKLQAKEVEANKQRQIEPTATSTLQEIMDEQVAQRIYQKEAQKWKDLTPDNLAAKLTRNKLFTSFPTVDQDTLLEILHAHDNKYQDTVETLLASTRPEDVRGCPNSIKEPPLKEEVITEMKEAQENCTDEVYAEQKEATYYRDEANRYLKKRADLYQKAQQYHQRGMTEVAQFFSGLASQQTVYFDRANNMAATAFLDEHSKRLQDFNTVDLHFLYVKEALSALDVFLDQNINLLRLSDGKRSEHLQIITGRGKRSENGLSKIKPATIARLKKRNIQYGNLNPGMLRVRITKHTLVTSEL